MFKSDCTVSYTNNEIYSITSIINQLNINILFEIANQNVFSTE